MKKKNRARLSLSKRVNNAVGVTKRLQLQKEAVKAEL